MMKRALLAIAFLGAVAFAIASISPGARSDDRQMAQIVPCGSLKLIEKALLEKSGETLQGVGLSNGNMWRFYASKSGSWTMAFVQPKNPRTLCIAFVGEGWHAVKKEMKGV